MIVGQFTSDLSIEVLFKKGTWVGLRYAGIWALGIAAVKCFIRGKNQSAKLASQ